MAAKHIIPQPSGGVWDSSQYGMILFDGYSQEQLSHVQRSVQPSVEPFYRRYASYRPIALRAGVEQTRAQWILFEAFWRVTLEWGQKWFELTLNSAGPAEVFTVRLTSWTQAPQLGTVQSLVRLDMNLEALLLDP